MELWDGSTGRVEDIVTIPADRGGVGQFRPGTMEVTILEGAGNVFTWDTRPSHALEFACRTAGRDITTDEWRTYVGAGDPISVCPQ